MVGVSDLELSWGASRTGWFLPVPGAVGQSTVSVLRLAEAAGLELAPAGLAQSGVRTF
jgi:hypothetical protein